ncbi:hypothetical protein [Glycomyces buryatensis]|uniref:Uncharacterized protein n=1 Tax=Glycomyces buryatensis TaxID=2570927 RepID=A0A4S8QE63_9ACTN|nr:hypothetical protein [Glycomyces buryatensis]THV41382.1 hypothetical protein FAB82_11985 [Glycomyces buryatensis]
MTDHYSTIRDFGRQAHVEPAVPVQKRAKPEHLGDWTTASGGSLSLTGRRGSEFATIWHNRTDGPVKIGRARHAGGVLRSVEWDDAHQDQTEFWKTQQRHQIAALIAAWHAEARP